MILPDDLTEMGGQAFYGCSSLASVHIGSALTSIPSQAFQGCTSLSDINFPEGLTSIGTFAFSGTQIPSLTLKGNISIGTSAFYNCTALASVDMGENKSVPQNCFRGCTNLSSVSFAPDTVVGDSAFYGCGFTSLSLSSFNVTSTPTSHGGRYSLGTMAFSQCAGLEDVDGYRYKWNVGLKTRTSYIDENGSRKWNDWEDQGQMESGIYDAMGATTDSVFSNTKLFELKDYLTNNQLVDTSDIQYSVYHFTG